MEQKRTAMIWVVGVVNIILGGMIAVGNTVEVITGTTFGGMPVDITAGILGMTGAVFAFLLFLGGIGTWRVEPYGRTLSIIAAAGTLVVSALAVILLGLPVSFLVAGGLYPLILLIIFNLPSWRRTFAADQAIA